MARAKRKAKKISIDELKNHILTKMEKYNPELDFDFERDFDIYELFEAFPKVEKDLEKISFDLENYEIEHFEEQRDFAYIGISAGGDWEMPIYFIIYLDHKNQLRGYIPTEGNVFNRTIKEAFGNDEEEDEKDAKKQGYDSYEKIEFDWKKMREDINNRMEVV